MKRNFIELCDVGTYLAYKIVKIHSINIPYIYLSEASGTKDIKMN